MMEVLDNLPHDRWVLAVGISHTVAVGVSHTVAVGISHTVAVGLPYSYIKGMAQQWGTANKAAVASCRAAESNVRCRYVITTFEL
jgi:hypothetical protein